MNVIGHKRKINVTFPKKIIYKLIYKQINTISSLPQNYKPITLNYKMIKITSNKSQNIILNNLYKNE